MTSPESVALVDSNIISPEDQRDAVLKMQEEIKLLANRHRKILPKQFFVGNEDPYEGAAERTESYPKGILYIPESNRLVRIAYSEVPVVLYDPITGEQSIDNKDTAITSLPVRDDHWLRYGPNAIQWINRIVSDRTRPQEGS